MENIHYKEIIHKFDAPDQNLFYENEIIIAVFIFFYIQPISF